MSSHLHRHPATAQAAEFFRQSFPRRRHAAFPDDVALIVQHAIPAGLVAQVHADRDRPLARLAGSPRTLFSSDILFHSRSPFAPRVRTIGSLSHPAGGRPSHSISEMRPHIISRSE